MPYTREYYQDLNYHPFLCYVVLNVEEGSLRISKEKHHVDEIPVVLDISIYCQQVE